MTMFYSKKILKLPHNKLGRDFIVGDIHGRFDLLVLGLEAINFNENTDRVISVGDLIDRGVYSELVADFMKFPFFYAVRGNHEDCLIELMSYDIAPAEFIEYHKYKMGSEWWFRLTKEQQQVTVESIRNAPLIIEIETEDGKVGVIHADIPDYYSWEEFKSEIEQEDSSSILQVLWGRNRLDYSIESEIKGVSKVFVGHTVQAKARKLANVIAIDTGAVFRNHLTIFELGAETQTLNSDEDIYADICIYTKDSGRKDFIMTESKKVMLM